MHLRFGSVARGGLRWSDRREDFRTEVLGLVKAQMVKNAVIVPVGAKGGFFCKQLPDPRRPRRVAGRGRRLLHDVHLRAARHHRQPASTARSCRRRDVVRHDGDDTYLVVAADKGTATFSDIANGSRQDYGFWLGDAFASGGSVGYDHKAMGITARGAWESVKRHFRELGIDSQTEDFTCVGIGDMSGDVFGNGMLLSEHIRLVAAFDHRHIFLDPDPDAAASYAERRRLFELPRSSWARLRPRPDLRGRRRLPALGEVDPDHARRCAPRSASTTTSTKLTPAELMRAILQAPVDLLWNGGIGTYVKAAERDPRRRRRQGQRRDPGRRRATCAPSASARAATSASPSSGRIEYAAARRPDQHRLHRQLRRRRHLRPRGQHQDPARPGGRGRRPDREAAQRAARRDDRRGRRAGAARQLRAEPRARQRARRTRRRCCTCTRTGCSSSSARACSTARSSSCRSTAGRRRRSGARGSPRPELAVLLAYTKIVLADELLDADLPDDPFLRRRPARLLPDGDAARATARRWTRTRCAARSS